MIDDRIKDLLDSAAPDRPDLGHAARMSAVRERSRSLTQRLRLAVAGVVAALVGVGVAVPLLAGGSSGGFADDPAPDRPEVAEVEPAACPTTPVDVTGGTAAADLPDGATSARLCPATYDGFAGGVDFTLPTEPVVEEIDELVATLRDLPPSKLPDECMFTTPLQMPWALVVSYPDGTTREIGAGTTSCATVTVGGTTVVVEAVLEAVEFAIIAQAPEPTGDPASCPPADPFLAAAPDTYEGSLDDFFPVSAAVCYAVDPMGGREYARDTGTLDRTGLNVVMGDLRMELTAEAGSDQVCADTGPTRLLVLADGEGRRLTFTDASCTGEFSGAPGFYAPDDVADDVLAAALGGRVRG